MSTARAKASRCINRPLTFSCLCVDLATQIVLRTGCVIRIRSVWCPRSMCWGWRCPGPCPSGSRRR